MKNQARRIIAVLIFCTMAVGMFTASGNYYGSGVAYQRVLIEYYDELTIYEMLEIIDADCEEYLEENGITAFEQTVEETTDYIITTTEVTQLLSSVEYASGNVVETYANTVSIEALPIEYAEESSLDTPTITNLTGLAIMPLSTSNHSRSSSRMDGSLSARVTLRVDYRRTAGTGVNRGVNMLSIIRTVSTVSPPSPVRIRVEAVRVEMNQSGRTAEGRHRGQFVAHNAFVVGGIRSNGGTFSISTSSG